MDVRSETEWRKEVRPQRRTMKPRCSRNRECPLGNNHGAKGPLRKKEKTFQQRLLGGGHKRFKEKRRASRSSIERNNTNEGGAGRYQSQRECDKHAFGEKNYEVNSDTITISGCEGSGPNWYRKPYRGRCSARVEKRWTACTVLTGLSSRGVVREEPVDQRRQEPEKSRVEYK